MIYQDAIIMFAFLISFKSFIWTVLTGSHRPVLSSYALLLHPVFTFYFLVLLKSSSFDHKAALQRFGVYFLM